MDSRRIDLKLKLTNGNNLYFDITENDIKNIYKLIESYRLLPEYNRNKDYINNMIKVASSDIDIENNNETSVIESLAAVCCNKIKDKNQRTAFNLLNMLKSGILDENTVFSHEYIVRIWRELTYKNRNILATGDGYRRTKVEVRKIDKRNPLGRVIYTAPDFKKVHNMMTDLIQVNNTAILNYNNEINGIIKSIVFIAYFVYIHPFMDGNGRTARLLGNKILIDNGLSKFRYISINSEIAKVKSEYSAHLEEIEKTNTGDITHYIRFMINVFNSLMSRLNNKNYLKLNYNELNKRQKVMLNYIKACSQGIAIKKYKKIWNSIASEQYMEKIDIKTVNADIEKLLDLGFIVYDPRYTLYPGFKYYNK